MFQIANREHHAHHVQSICSIRSSESVIHLGVLSNRIPILAPFRLVHGETPESIAVSDVFDLHYLSAMLDDMPLVELHELKHTFGIRPRLQTIVYDGEVPQWTENGRALVKGDLLLEEPSLREKLGCWSTTESRGERSGMSADGLMDVGELPSCLQHPRVVSCPCSCPPSQGCPCFQVPITDY